MQLSNMDNILRIADGRTDTTLNIITTWCFTACSKMSITWE